MNRLRLGIVSCGFLGLSPFAPASMGTLGGVVLVWSLSGTRAYPLWTALACLGLFALGRALGGWAERWAGRKDPSFFVLDEVVGYLVTCLWWKGPSPLGLAVAFFSFRFFDIVKPPPARALERLGGGDGIMLDDLVAGIYGLATLALLRGLFLEPATWSA